LELDTALLDAAQALCIALPAAGVPALLLIPPGRALALCWAAHGAGPWLAALALSLLAAALAAPEDPFLRGRARRRHPRR
jgi:hypothetical protein